MKKIALMLLGSMIILASCSEGWYDSKNRKPNNKPLPNHKHKPVHK